MCRFLLARSDLGALPEDLPAQFAAMCEKSRTLDEDRQGDGYGLAWQIDGNWHSHKSLAPIWQEPAIIEHLAETNLLVAHARSASFNEHKGKIEFNQPFIEGNFCFVFNGLIRKVKLPYPVPGEIGSQKIFSLLNQLNKQDNLLQSLDDLGRLLSEHAHEISGMNIGVVAQRSFYVLSMSRPAQRYFTLYKLVSRQLTLICSEPLEFGSWQPIQSDLPIRF